MTNEVKNKAAGREHGRGADGEAMDRSDIANIQKRSDRKEAADFANKLAGKRDKGGDAETTKLYRSPFDVLRERGGGGGSQSWEHGHDRDNKNAEAERAAAARGGHAVLHSLQAQHVAPSSNDAAEAIASLSVQVAERILATQEALNARQEVRIALQDSILSDTEIIVSKNGRLLNVCFVTRSNESAEIINARSGELRTQLMEKLPMVDSVEIELEYDPQGGEREHGGGSGGNQDSGGHGDGDQSDSPDN